MYGPFGKDGFPIENREVVAGPSIEGFKADVFLADDKLLYLRHQPFKPDLSPVKLQDVTQPHLIPSPGFLEAIPHHRSFWTIDTKLHYDIATGFGGVHGDILVIDGSALYRGAWLPAWPHRMVRSADQRLHALCGSIRRCGELPASPGTSAAKREVTAKKGMPRPRPRQAAAGQKIAPSAKLWSSSMPLTGKAMALAGNVVFVAGTPLVFPQDDLAKAYEGRMGGILWAASSSTGEKLAQYKLDAPPAWDGLAAANGLLFLVAGRRAYRVHGSAVRRIEQEVRHAGRRADSYKIVRRTLEEKDYAHTTFIVFVLWLAVTSACSADELKRMEWKIEGITREAMVHVSPMANATPSPLLFVFHGHSGTMKGTAAGKAYHRLWPEVICVYMQGLKTPGALGGDPEGKQSGWQVFEGEQNDEI